ncbi:hypothetical protein ACFFKE_07840 [Streptomyces mutabilis]|uniref:hypothetical protein n=1 Tax=Streptomyces mutabilis TaxID=67332 RepID=UPI0019AF7E84|nr:hypothetical protein [Streptomyces mutabilis]GGQ20941.1 hypothetical protein GCM10010279_30850 [Streptomyces mutabilis]
MRGGQRPGRPGRSHPLASAGSRGDDSARGTEGIAREDSAAWVYGAFAQPARDKVTTGPVTSFTTTSGIAGSVATSRSSRVEKGSKCDVDDEVPDGTVRNILATVRYVPDKGQ